MFGGIHATLFPEESHELGGAHAVVKGDGERAWPEALRDCAAGTLRRQYDGGRVEGDTFLPGRWDLLPEGRYMWASVQTVRGCPKHCSFCSVWRTDGQRPRAATRRQGHRRDRRAAAARLPLHRARRRQLLSGHARRSAHGGAAARTRRSSNGCRHPRRALRADGSAGAAARRHGVLHADHDGGGRRSRVPRRDASRPHQGRARRRRGGDARRAEGRLQGLQLQRRSARRAAAGVPAPRRARARLVHLRPAERPREHVRRDARGRRAGRRDVRAVRDADAVSRARSISRRGRRASARIRRRSAACRSRATG